MSVCAVWQHLLEMRTVALTLPRLSWYLIIGALGYLALRRIWRK